MLKKWVTRLALGALALVAVVSGAGLVYEQWSRWSTARAFLPVGELVNVAGRWSHIHCSGAGTPTVVLGAGWDPAGSLAWAQVQGELARVTRVCSYDRAGILWSERREEPRDGIRIAAELHALLGAASVPPPYVMVGHSLGGLLVRVFADRFPGEVAGFVFVDSAHPEQLERFPPEVVAALESMSLPPAFIIKAVAATGILRRSPPSLPKGLPREVRDITLGYLPRSIVGMLGEDGATGVIKKQAAATGPFADLPLVVLTAGRVQEPLPPAMSRDVARQYQETWHVLQGELAALSTNADQRVIQDATHYIQLDNPAAVIAAILDVVTAVREGGPVRSVDE